MQHSSGSCLEAVELVYPGYLVCVWGGGGGGGEGADKKYKPRIGN